MKLHLNITQDLGHGLMIIFICCVLTATVVVIDLITGVRAAKKVGEPIRSHILRRTINKIIDYYMVVFFGVLIDVIGLFFPWYNIPYACITATLAVMVIEGRSMFENLTKAKSPAAMVDDTITEIIQEIIDAKSSKSALKIIEKLKKEGNEEK